MNNSNINEIISDFSECCHNMSEAYQKGENKKGNKERAKVIAYYKRFVMDKDLFHNCIADLIESDDEAVRDFASSMCLSLNYEVDKALSIKQFNYNKKEPDHYSISALMALSDWERKGKLEICETKEINGIAGVPISVTDIESYTDYIRNQVGDYETVYMELTNKYLPIDIIVVPPTKEKNYYTLVTMGALYYKMPVPDYYGKMNRAEFAIRLPANWKIDDPSKEWQWPFEVLKTIARLPCMEKSWLGWYHDVKFKRGFAKATPFTGIVLDVYDESFEPLTLECGDQVILYNSIPVFQKELDYCLEHGGKELIEKMDESIKFSPINNHRECVV